MVTLTLIIPYRQLLHEIIVFKTVAKVRHDRLWNHGRVYLSYYKTSLCVETQQQTHSKGWVSKQATGALGCGLSHARLRPLHMSVWPAWDSHSGVNSSRLNADDTQQHLEFLLCDPWNQSHFCASLTRRKKEVVAPPPKPNLIGIAKFPPAGYSGPHSADICSVICQPSLIECTFTSDIVSVWPGCTLPRLISVYIIEGLRPATSIRKHRPSLVDF